MKKPKKCAYRVWLSQVNQTIIDVNAESRATAEEKAIRQWKREYEPRVTTIEKMEGDVIVDDKGRVAR